MGVNAEQPVQECDDAEALEERPSGGADAADRKPIDQDTPLAADRSRNG
ncbi:hypothetical protein ACVIHI_002380 [Bradyrhizobium sp. USDA 4524]|nr:MULTISPECIES: hypothetical protein [unclassified Bradyrhizobium]MCP1844697.1 hypothetical protein [Bradyrhizobium sp. USDA 4538]